MIYVPVSLQVPSSERKTYEALFRVEAGATDCLAPGAELAKVGIEPIGKAAYELANGDLKEYPFGLAQIEFMGEVTASRVIFGPDEAEPILGNTVLKSVAIAVEPKSRTLEKRPAIPLK